MRTITAFGNAARQDDRPLHILVRACFDLAALEERDQADLLLPIATTSSTIEVPTIAQIEVQRQSGSRPLLKLSRKMVAIARHISDVAIAIDFLVAA